jgi:cell shape-determining protein MreD
MKNFSWKFFLVVAVVFGQSYFANFLWLQKAPNLVLVLVIAWVAVAGFNKSLPWVIFLGALSDLVFLKPIGFFVIFYTLIAYLFHFLSARLWTKNRWSGLLALLVFIFLTNIIFASYSILDFNWHNLLKVFLSLKVAIFEIEVAKLLVSVIFFYFSFHFLDYLKKYAIKIYN